MTLVITVNNFAESRSACANQFFLNLINSWIGFNEANRQFEQFQEKLTHYVHVLGRSITCIKETAPFVRIAINFN